MAEPLSYGFPTVFGRNLVPELANFVHRPFLVATMADLWDKFKDDLEGADCRPYIVESMDQADLERDLAELPMVEAVVGLGGGQALDAAKYVAWRRRLPLFQVPTALSVNAVYSQRSGIRVDGKVLYRGWAIPEAIFIDYDIIGSAPAQLNYSGIGDILCFHTGVLDWQYADRIGRCEPKWPYDPGLAQQSLDKVEQVIRHATDICDLNPVGIEVLVDGLKWGTSYHGSGWCPRHIEGIDHFFFYTLENQTGRKFLHGQPVCLGVYAGALLHDSRAQEMLDTIVTVGLDIRPEAMGVSWADAERAFTGMRAFVKEAGLWHSIAHDVEITPAFVMTLRQNIESAYGLWEG